MFADPPYGGEGIQYGELSALWCAWLEPPLQPAHEDEIGENPIAGAIATRSQPGWPTVSGPCTARWRRVRG